MQLFSMCFFEFFSKKVTTRFKFRYLAYSQPLSIADPKIRFRREADDNNEGVSLDNNERYIEALVVVDQKMCNYHGEDAATQFTMAVLNMVKSFTVHELKLVSYGKLSHHSVSFYAFKGSVSSSIPCTCHLLVGLATSLSLVFTRHRAERGRKDRRRKTRSFHFPCSRILHHTICAENREGLVASRSVGLPLLSPFHGP